MLRFIDANRKGLAVLLSAALISGGLTVSTQAIAGPKFGPHPVFVHPGHHYGYGHGYGWGHGYGYGSGYGYGFGGAALAGGLVLGALAASAATTAAAEDCRVGRKPMVDAYGNKYFEQVRVCD